MESIPATYEGGVFHPAGEVPLAEHSKVVLDVWSEPLGEAVRVDGKSIEEEIAEIVATVPKNAFADVPHDLIDRLDEHL